MLIHYFGHLLGIVLLCTTTYNSNFYTIINNIFP